MKRQFTHALAITLGAVVSATALAKDSGLPILCLGNDFAHTDVEVLPAR